MDNPGNIVIAPETVEYPGTLGFCGALQQCANAAAVYPTVAYSFDIHYLIAEQVWQCVLFYEINPDPSYFNVANSDVGLAFGYTLVF